MDDVTFTIPIHMYNQATLEKRKLRNRLEAALYLLRFAVNNADKFTEWDRDGVKSQWLDEARRVIAEAERAE